MNTNSELEVQEEVDAASYSVEGMTDAYLKALKKDWKGFKKFYDSYGEDVLFSPLTVNGENAFHFAAASKDANLVKALLDKLPDPFKKLEALTAPDDNRNTALHEVATTNCVEAAKQMVPILFPYGNEDEKNLMIWNKLGETPLYRAAALGKTKMLQYLAKQIDPNVLHLHFRRHHNSISILHIAVIGQHFETDIWLLKKEAELLDTNGSYGDGAERLAKREEENGMTPFNLLALMPTVFRSTRPMSKWKEFVYFFLPMLLLHDHNDEDNDEEKDKFSSSQGQDIETGKNINESICQTKNQTAISKLWIAIWRGLIKVCPKIKKIWKEKLKHELALKLVELLAEQDTSWKKIYKDEKVPTVSLGLGKGEGRKIPGSEDQKASGISKNKLTTSTEKSNPTEKSICSSTDQREGSKKNKRSSVEAPLVMAANNGITEIFDCILMKHPQAVDYISDYGQNILDAAIMFRQKQIFGRILSMEKRIVYRLATRIDKFGYTVLHHVADMCYYREGTRSGPALQFQEELEWFENVKAIMPSHYTMHRSNERRMTAGDLFEDQHAMQLKDAQQWMKDTSQSCSTVSILVATVVFAAAYTVPGGNNDQGVPIFLHSPLFWVFTVMDVVSLISSLCSVVMFLSILTSPFKPEAFLKSLPKKLTIGFSLLFFSVLSSMITFTAALLLLVRLNRRWTTTLVYVAAFIPAVLFALMQFRLFSEFLGSLMVLYKKFIWKKFIRPSTRKKNWK